MPVKFGTVVFEKSTNHLNVPHFFAISKARVLDKNAQNGLKHHLANVSGRNFCPLPSEWTPNTSTARWEEIPTSP